MSTQPTQRFVPIVPKRVLLGLFGAGFLLECLTLPHYLRVKNSAAWPHTQGVITTSRLEGNYSWKRERIEGFYAVIGYDYHVGGVKFHGTRISFNKVHVAVLEAWQPVVDMYPVGKNVAVYYDPEEPGFAVLEPGLFDEMHILYVMCIVLLILFGSLFLLVLFRT